MIRPHLRGLLAGVALALGLGPAQATPNYHVEGASWVTGFYYRADDHQALDRRFGQPDQPGVFAQSAAGLAGQHAHYAQTSLGYGVDDSGWAGVRTDGRLQIVAAQPGGPAFVDATVTLRLSGGVTLHTQDAAFASGGVDVRLFGPGDDARLVEGWTAGVGSGPPVVDNLHLWRTGPDTLVASVRWPVDQVFSVTLMMFANGASSGLGQVDLSTDYRLSLDDRGAVLGLPAGYTAWSSDWGIEDNHFCPAGCAPVPEPGTAWLGVVGLGGLALLRVPTWRGLARRSRRAAALTRVPATPMRPHSGPGGARFW